MPLPEPIGIYAVLDADTLAPDRLPGAALTMAGEGVRVFQVRGKSLSGRALLALVTAVRDALGPGPTLLVNDRVDVAALAPCDGVHLGDQDLPVAAARRLLPPGAIVGYSTHSIDEAALDHGADYIGFGPVFASTTKPSGRTPLGIEGLRQACGAAPVPVVGIGGIGLDAVAELRRAGASGIAMISALLSTPDVRPTAAAAVRGFQGTEPLDGGRS